jgi:glutathione S-transferase
LTAATADAAPGQRVALAGLDFYGLDLSYFTGKVEAYLRYREIPHQRHELTVGLLREVARHTGLAQMPAIRLPDGRWLSDSTPMIAWMDSQLPGPPVLPDDLLQRFFSQILEDYADEWLWRPALHYRWSYKADATLMSRRIAAEMMTDIPLPLAARQFMILRRQISKYVTGDGVTAATRAHVESIYTRNLRFLQTILQTRPYLLGGRPTLADFGFFASMFRHFGLDPTPARIMRDTAPAVYEWLARLWNAQASRMPADAPMQEGLPADWQPILRDAATCYLPYLHANAAAWAARQRHFNVTIEGTTYRLPVHRYRVWCLQRLQALHAALPGHVAVEANEILRETGLDAALHAAPAPASGFDPAGRAPFFEPAHVWAQSTQKESASFLQKRTACLPLFPTEDPP